MDEVTWGALTITLTSLGGLYTWFAFRRRGFVAGLRGVGVSVIPLALLLTDTLRMVTRIGAAVGDWVTSLVLDPTVWAGIALAIASVACFVVAGALSSRGIGSSRRTAPEADLPSTRRPTLPGTAQAPGSTAPKPRSAARAQAPVDDEMAEIEALLRKRGIE